MRRQLALTTLATAGLIIVAFLVPLGLLVRDIAADRALDRAERAADSLVPTIALGMSAETLETTVSGVEQTGVGEVSIVLADDRVVGSPVDVDADVGRARGGEAFSTPIPGGIAVLVPAILPDGQAHVVRVAVPDERLREGVVVSWVLLGVLGFGLLLVALVVADRLARRVVAPVSELADVAHRLGSGDLAARVVPTGPDEIAEVGQTLNQLADRIRDLLAAERETVADLSHRLRTPVTALRLDVELIDDPAQRDRVSRDVDELTRAVDQLIDEARHTSAAAGPAPGRSCDLVDAVRARLAFWGLIAEEQGRAHWLEAPEAPCPVAVDASDLDAALDALLGNVIAHTPEGTAFSLTVVGDRRLLLVDDEGPGFPADTDPLARGESGGGSTGLGLDIVRTTAERSGGRITLGTSPAGGARITVEFGAPDDTSGP